MSNDIVKAEPAQRGGGALSLGVMTPHEAWLFASSLADTPLLPDAYRKNPASVLWALEYGRALGLDVVTTITTIHVIKGKPTQSADLMHSRARSAGHKVRIRQEPGQCTVSIWRSDDTEFENQITWTYDDAVTAGLCEIRNNRPYSRSQKGEPQNWEKYPRAMLRSRAIAECVRSACPEVLHGAIYTPEELGARVDAEGLPIEAEIQRLRPVPAGEPDQWATPTATVQAATADVPPESLTPAGRDYLHEAHAAPDAETVRQIWVDARAEGARPEYLEQIAAVGKDKVATPRPAAEPAPADDVVDAEVVDPVDDYAAAVAELRAAAEAARLDDFEDGAAKALGCPIADASTEAIRALAAQIRPAA
ncbi:recombinase RecT [Streptomyces sp. NPDC060064]|uniref:recombinase RecT n=1 Tax=Streptomyces sp. NPDC060064 TaxID=3347049 RepID=UPI0036A2C1A2